MITDRSQSRSQNLFLCFIIELNQSIKAITHIVPMDRVARQSALALRHQVQVADRLRSQLPIHVRVRVVELVRVKVDAALGFVARNEVTKRQRKQTYAKPFLMICEHMSTQSGMCSETRTSESGLATPSAFMSSKYSFSYLAREIKRAGDSRTYLVDSSAHNFLTSSGSSVLPRRSSSRSLRGPLAVAMAAAASLPTCAASSASSWS